MAVNPLSTQDRIATDTILQNNRITSLRILTYNIQSGLTSPNLSSHIRNSVKNILPSNQRMGNLKQISYLLQDFDIVALQEVDPGSLRSGFVNQVQYLAKEGGFPHWYLQLNRNFGKLAKFSNAVLSRYEAMDTDTHKLPGMIPGRGAIRLAFGNEFEPLILVIAHLALGPVARRLQLNYIANLVKNHKHVILMGDMNCHWSRLKKSKLFKELELRPVNYLFPTYPSWKPRRNIDHIFISPSVRVTDVKVLDYTLSDHLPISLEVILPTAIT